jgi:hypothetical protein
VVTERNVVYLMGRVTQREANRATEIARGVEGVQKVVRLFEIIRRGAQDPDADAAQERRAGQGRQLIPRGAGRPRPHRAVGAWRARFLAARSAGA